MVSGCRSLIDRVEMFVILRVMGYRMKDVG